MKFKNIFIFILLFICLCIYSEITDNDVFYQIYPNCFYDSNNDGIGDFKGISEKLDYIKDLGATIIWVNPIYLSPFEHKYFSDDFYEVDPELGTKEDFRNLCKEVHKRGMKILIDMETQYITQNHIWFKDSYKNPSSKYSSYIRYNDNENSDPESIIAKIREIRGEKGEIVRLMSLNMNNPEVLDYQKKLYGYWLDPDMDGNLEDGVDGFRMDHIMDDLDYKGFAKNLLHGFWKPVVDYTREIKPGCIYLSEPSDWGYGLDILKKADMDASIFMKTREALIFHDKFEFDKDKMENILVGSDIKLYNKYLCTVIENHDTSRWATTCKENQGLLKIGAVLTSMLKPLPHIYYGQELGQTGRKDLGNRDAFKWTKEYESIGMAFKKRRIKRENDVSYAEQKDNDESLYNYYKKLIELRKNNPALNKGELSILKQKNKNVLSFIRNHSYENIDQKIVVIINFSDKNQMISLNLEKYFNENKKNIFSDLIGNRIYSKLVRINAKNYKLSLKKFEVVIIELGNSN